MMTEANRYASEHSPKRSRWNYYRRLWGAYVLRRNSHLTFWHGTPQVNAEASVDRLGQYYMLFAEKADYPGPFDGSGIPLLDYHGRIGKQYNPIAIAQYGLGNYNLWKRDGSEERRSRFLRASDWLVEHLEPNPWGTPVWNHHFDWEYRDVLKSPWYSGLAQGQGLSVLTRAHKETGDDVYLDACRQAFLALESELDEGGVRYTDDEGNVWIEEVVVRPPTHILNGFLWAAWGVWDYWLHTKDSRAESLLGQISMTMKNKLATYDTGFWSLYEHSGTRMKMLASPFYHSLHILQLRVMHNMTGEQTFADYADRWSQYQRSWLKRKSAFIYKAVFKLLYY